VSYLEYITVDPGAGNPLEALSRVNRFSLADLEENRAGKISCSQRFRLLGKAWEPVRYTGAALFGWLITSFALSLLVPRAMLWVAAMIFAKSAGVWLSGVTFACVGAFLISVLKSAKTIALLLLDLMIGKVECLEGHVSGTREEEGGIGMARIYGEKHTKYSYAIKNEQFAVDEASYSALPQRGRFRLYHTPRSKLLLSIEPCQSAQ
jgi:hypothetical protein